MQHDYTMGFTHLHLNLTGPGCCRFPQQTGAQNSDITKSFPISVCFICVILVVSVITDAEARGNILQCFSLPGHDLVTQSHIKTIR